MINLKLVARQYLNYYKSRKQFYNKLRLFSQIVKPGDLCFDIGANIGDKVEIFNRLGCRIVAVEPQASCIERLRERFDRNDRVYIEAVGCSTCPGLEKMFISNIPELSTFSSYWMSHTRFANNPKVIWSDEVNVPTTTLDILIEKYGTPRFCKIDVEGYEFNVIRGLTKKIECLSFEFMSECLHNSIQVLTHLESIAPIRVNYVIGENASLYCSEKSWLMPNELIDKLQACSNNKLWGDIYVKML